MLDRDFTVVFYQAAIFGGTIIDFLVVILCQVKRYRWIQRYSSTVLCSSLPPRVFSDMIDDRVGSNGTVFSLSKGTIDHFATPYMWFRTFGTKFSVIDQILHIL